MENFTFCAVLCEQIDNVHENKYSSDDTKH